VNFYVLNYMFILLHELTLLCVFGNDRVIRYTGADVVSGGAGDT